MIRVRSGSIMARGLLIAPGYTSNYGKKKKATYVYLTATLDAAIWGRSWRSAKVPAESTQWNRPVQLWITPT
jgi:Rifampin ADP-ribosyl transferase